MDTVVDPRVAPLAQELCLTDNRVVMRFPEFEHDWRLIVCFAIDLLLECVRITSKTQVASRNDVDMAQLPLILAKIARTTGVEITITHLDNTVSQDMLCAHPHLPLSQWYYVSCVLQIQMRFRRIWSLSPSNN